MHAAAAGLDQTFVSLTFESMRYCKGATIPKGTVLHFAVWHATVPATACVKRKGAVVIATYKIGPTFGIRVTIP